MHNVRTDESFIGNIAFLRILDASHICTQGPIQYILVEVEVVVALTLAMGTGIGMESALGSLLVNTTCVLPAGIELKQGGGGYSESVSSVLVLHA